MDHYSELPPPSVDDCVFEVTKKLIKCGVMKDDAMKFAGWAVKTETGTDGVVRASLAGWMVFVKPRCLHIGYAAWAMYRSGFPECVSKNIALFVS